MAAAHLSARVAALNDQLQHLEDLGRTKNSCTSSDGRARDICDG